jgi:cobalt/nickel transport system ATP-binding protein
VTPPVFELREVSYRYQDIPAIDNLSLTIARGERVALLGANGSGKSTLLQLLDALIFPCSGEIMFHGESLAEDRVSFEFRRRVGLVFQSPDVQLFNPTVFDEIAFAPLQLGWTKDETLRRIDEALEMMEIGHLRSRPPHRLSGGEKKRVALASVLVLDPEVLLLDEPTAALDPHSQSQIIELLRDSSHDRTALIATHDLDLAAGIADRCVILDHGRVVADAATSDILRDEPMLERFNLIRHPRVRQC